MTTIPGPGLANVEDEPEPEAPGGVVALPPEPVEWALAPLEEEDDRPKKLLPMPIAPPLDFSFSLPSLPPAPPLPPAAVPPLPPAAPPGDEDERSV